MSNMERKESNFSQLEGFNRDLIDLAPMDMRVRLKSHLSFFDEDKPKIGERAIEFLGGLGGLSKLEKALSLPRHNIESHIIPSIESSPKKEHQLSVLAVLIGCVPGKPLKYSGYVDFYFYHNPKNHQPEIYIITHALMAQGEGVGLDMECRLEDFCRKHGVWTVKNRPTSVKEAGYVGGYVWALYGYEFVDETDVEAVKKDIRKFAREQEFSIDDDVLNQCERPVDFALLKGKDKNGGEAPVGKLALLESSQWRGRRDLRFNSQGTKDFADYLILRNRLDLIEDYFIKPLNPQTDKEFIDYLAAKLAEKGRADLLTEHFPQFLEKKGK